MRVVAAPCAIPNHSSRGRFQRIILFTGLFVLPVVGCDRFKPGSTSRPAGSQPSQAAVTTNGPRTLGVDGDDDPRGPVYLPTSQNSGNWVKVEPVKVFAAAALDRVLPAAEAGRLGLFRLKLGATCAYSVRLSHGKPVTAKVRVIEAVTADDAYGVLTCRSGSPEVYRIGGETRVEHQGGLALHCWQGKAYIHLAAGEEDSELTEEMIRLLMNICGKIPREETPAILRALPEENRRPGKLWLVRQPASIRPDAIELGYSLDMAHVASILGLGKDTLMCIASYDLADAQRPNTVWVVSYPTVKSAHDAYARFSRLLSIGTDPAVTSANVLPAQGSYLVGTWTAEEESMQYLLPRIMQLLPS